MIFHRSLSDSKSPQVSRTFLSILTDLNNAVVWVVSTRPLISKSSSTCINPFLTVPRSPITFGINVGLFFFSIPKLGPGVYPYFHFLSILLFGPLGQQRPQFCKFSLFLFLFFFYYYKVWLSGRD